MYSSGFQGWRPWTGRTRSTRRWTSLSFDRCLRGLEGGRSWTILLDLSTMTLHWSVFIWLARWVVQDLPGGGQDCVYWSVFIWLETWEALSWPYKIYNTVDKTVSIDRCLSGWKGWKPWAGLTRSTIWWTRLCLLIGVYLVVKVGSPELAVQYVQDLQYGGQDCVYWSVFIWLERWEALSWPYKIYNMVDKTVSIDRCLSGWKGGKPWAGRTRSTIRWTRRCRCCWRTRSASLSCRPLIPSPWRNDSAPLRSVSATVRSRWAHIQTAVLEIV